ncbi:MAG: G1 family glutamic endopeptidase [Methanospirillum sp.]
MRPLPILCGAVLFGALLLCGCLGGGDGTATPVPTPVLPDGSATPAPTGAATSPTSTPALLTSAAMADRSPNWAGYAVQTNFDSPASDVVDAVEATWNVPPVDCAGSNGNDYASAFWVGIDGISSNSVEQIGTESDCIGGVPTYYTWYEVFPQDSVTLDLAISPGDQVHAKVEYVSNNEFKYTITDLTTAQTVSFTDQGRVTADRSSAEWVAEAPTNGRNRLLPLAQFGPVVFTNASVTVNGKNGPISSANWQYQPIIMESRSGSLKATPSVLGAGGTGFSVVWQNS